MATRKVVNLLSGDYETGVPLVKVHPPQYVTVTLHRELVKNMRDHLDVMNTLLDGGLGRDTGANDLIEKFLTTIGWVNDENL